jgi:RHS repeat-associated protein
MRILAGQYFDSETGLYYWGARYYDPKTGRGIQPDRMSVAEHVQRKLANLGKPNQPPLELNPYTYAYNNPLRWIDPDGLETKLNLFEGANGAGHLGLQPGNSPSRGKYPRDNDALTKN